MIPRITGKKTGKILETSSTEYWKNGFACHSLRIRKLSGAALYPSLTARV
jgi:hypothetical protein